MYRDVVEELGHVFDDLTVLGGLSLQQLLDDHHTLGHHRLCKGDTADVDTKFKPRASQFGTAQQSAVTFTQRYNAHASPLCCFFKLDT